MTGSLRWGETAAECAAREVREETGLATDGLRDAHVQRVFPILPAWRDRYAPDVETNLEHLWYLELPQVTGIRRNRGRALRLRVAAVDAAIRKVSSWTNREALERLRDSRGLALSSRAPGSRRVSHGVWLRGTETWLLRRNLREAGYDVTLFRYHSVTAGLQVNAARLAEFLAQRAECRRAPRRPQLGRPRHPRGARAAFGCLRANRVSRLPAEWQRRRIGRRRMAVRPADHRQEPR